MKNFYLLILLACTALSGFAQIPVAKSAQAGKINLQPRETSIRAKAPRQLDAIAKADATVTWKDLGKGTYSDAILSNMYEMITNNPVEVSIQESEQTPGLYRIVYPWPIFLEAEYNYLIVDASDPDFVIIPKQPCPVDDIDDGETWVASLSAIAVDDYGYNGEEFREDFPDLNITLKDGIIRIPAGCACFMWPEATSGYADPGEWVEADDAYEGYITLPGYEFVEEWQSIGKGKFLDGYVSTFISYDTPAEIEVEIQHNIYSPGLYKLIRPFAQLYDYSRDLIIDATDPDFVKITTQSTGIPLQTYGTMYILSISSNNYDNLDDFVADGYGDANISLVDNRINIPADALLMYFPSYNAAKMYYNEDAIDSYIILPSQSAINSIAADCGTTLQPVEYFNLQGHRVDNPSGGLYIMRQGNKSTKILIK